MNQESVVRVMKRSRKLIASLDRHTLDQLVEMAGEALGLEDWKGMEATREVLSEAKKFEKEAERALKEWVAKNPEAMEEGYDADDLYDEEGAYLVLMTLRGEGVGIWDGSWDHFFVDEDEACRELEHFLKRKLGRFADDTGAGSLNEAFFNAAYEQTEYQD